MAATRERDRNAPEHGFGVDFFWERDAPEHGFDGADFWFLVSDRGLRVLAARRAARLSRGGERLPTQHRGERIRVGAPLSLGSLALFPQLFVQNFPDMIEAKRANRKE